MIYLSEILLCFLIFMAGACVFSFLAVVGERVPEGRSFIGGRSSCSSCGHNLAPWDLVPVFSWLILKGKCRYCKERIPVRCVVMEAVGGVFALTAAAVEGFTLQGLFLFLFMGLLTLVALVDWDTMEIPNGFVAAIFCLAAVKTLLWGHPPYLDAVIGFFAVSVPLLLITLAIPGAFGGGDIKLMAACGVFLGWKNVLVAFFLAVLGGGLYGIFLLAGKKKGRKDHFPFGPFLCGGMIVALIWGESLLNWYLSLF